jgi:hypothetical protein
MIRQDRDELDLAGCLVAAIGLACGTLLLWGVLWVAAEVLSAAWRLLTQ